MLGRDSVTRHRGSWEDLLDPEPLSSLGSAWAEQGMGPGVSRGGVQGPAGGDQGKGCREGKPSRGREAALSVRGRARDGGGGSAREEDAML